MIKVGGSINRTQLKLYPTHAFYPYNCIIPEFDQTALAHSGDKKWCSFRRMWVGVKQKWDWIWASIGT
jgi:hypothetical protein